MASKKGFIKRLENMRLEEKVGSKITEIGSSMESSINLVKSINRFKNTKKESKSICFEMPFPKGVTRQALSKTCGNQRMKKNGKCIIAS